MKFKFIESQKIQLIIFTIRLTRKNIRDIIMDIKMISK